MLRPKTALQRALLVLLIPLLLPAAIYAGPDRCRFSDTVYLDRNGKEINTSPHSGTRTTFIVKTTLTTDELYDTDSLRKNHVQRGNTHPISEEEAGKTEELIKKGAFKEALTTGNLVKLRPLAERKKDVEFMLRDGGGGKDTAANNREYETVVYKNGTRRQIVSRLADPCRGGADAIPPPPKITTTYSHSHPSGTRDLGNVTCSFYPQAPSKGDIRQVPPKETRVVFGRATDMVYIYDSSGVIAMLLTEDYKNL